MRNILIFRQSSLGDFIVGIPAIKSIKKKFFNYKIHYLLYRHTEIGAVNPDTILNNNQLVDKFIYINKKDRSFIGLIKNEGCIVLCFVLDETIIAASLY